MSNYKLDIIKSSNTPILYQRGRQLQDAQNVVWAIPFIFLGCCICICISCCMCGRCEPPILVQNPNNFAVNCPTRDSPIDRHIIVNIIEEDPV